LLASALAARAADQATIAQGQKEEQRTCTPCHSLRIIHANRLSRAGWNRELDKMAGWGTKYTDREAILNIWWPPTATISRSHSGNERGRPREVIPTV
jgi:hypothetical protein